MTQRRERFDFTDEQKDAFGKLLREARQRKGVIQQVVAEETGVARATIGQMERGAYPGMNLVDVGRLVRYYDLDMDDVMHTLGL